MRILVIHGRGIEDERDLARSVKKFDASFDRALSRWGGEKAAGVVWSHSTYHEVVSPSVWETYPTEPDAYRTGRHKAASKWECKCCDDLGDRSFKKRAVQALNKSEVSLDVVLPYTFPDVQAWLERPGYRALLTEEVVSSVEEPPDVIVAHSMGSLVALDLVASRRESLEPSVLITCGSPVGWLSLAKRLPTEIHRWVEDRSTAWVNLQDLSDEKAGCSSASTELFPGIVNVRVRNKRSSDDSHHRFSRYVSHKSLAKLLVDIERGHVQPRDLDSRRLRKLKACRVR